MSEATQCTPVGEDKLTGPQLARLAAQRGYRAAAKETGTSVGAVWWAVRNHRDEYLAAGGKTNGKPLKPTLSLKRFEDYNWTFQRERYYSYGRVIGDAELGVFLAVDTRDPMQVKFDTHLGKVTLRLSPFDALALLICQAYFPDHQLRCRFSGGELTWSRTPISNHRPKQP